MTASRSAERVGPDHLRQLLDAVVSLGAGQDLDTSLKQLTHAATELVDARYGAMGVLSTDRTHLSDFITVGIDSEGRALIGELPKGHGILGLLITDPRPLRLPDLSEHPDSFGFPPNHPPMTSFLGVPVYVGEEVYGNLYLTDKKSAAEFTDIDVQLASGLAAAAGTAIERARLHARVRDLAMVEDRERIARDLHDTVIQQLFATGLILQGATRLAESPEVASRIEQALDDLDLVIRQVRSSIFDLHATGPTAPSLRQKILAVVESLRDAIGHTPVLRIDGPIDSAVPPQVGDHLVAVVTEALANVARHANASSSTVTISLIEGDLRVEVDDDGVGPGPRRSSGRGLGNLVDRAEQLGGRFTYEPGPHSGTRVTWEIPLRPEN